LELPDN